MSNRYQLSRREVLRLAALGTVGAIIAACQNAVKPLASVSLAEPAKNIVLQAAPTAGAGPTLVDGIPVTANDDFYTVAAIGDAAPPIPVDWKLTLTGQVEHTLALTLDQLKALASVTEMRTLECISNPAGGELISNAIWKGIRLKDLLLQAGVKPNGAYLRLESFDGYFTTIPLDLGMDEHALLVYEMNGVPLPADHGAPLRCLWPGRYGMKQPKWIQTITVDENSSLGYWEKQRWSNDALIRPNSRIDSPPNLATITTPAFTLSGIAFTNANGLNKLDIGWEDPKGWQAAELTRTPSPYVWTPWKWTGPALPAGRHTMYARATDNGGQVQTLSQDVNLLGNTFPDGTMDMPSLVLDFKG